MFFREDQKNMNSGQSAGISSDDRKSIDLLIFAYRQSFVDIL